MGYVKKTEIRNFARRKDLRVAGDFYDAVDRMIDQALQKAAKRTVGNGRKTLKPVDL